MGIIDSMTRRGRTWLDGPADPGESRFGGRVVLGVAAFVLLLVVYYGVGGLASSRIDPDLGLRPDAASLPPGGSVTAGIAARLIAREVDEHGWTPNDSFLAPTMLLDEMPAFQDGLRRMVAATVTAFGSDADIAAAAEAFSTPSEEWWRPGGSPESRYQDGVEALRRYNSRLARGAAGIDRRPARLADILDAMADALDSAGVVTERRIRGRSTAEDPEIAEQFNAVRGEAYAAALLVRALRDDHSATIRARQLGAAWGETIDAFDALVAIDPWTVDASDLTAQGYYLLLARNKLRGIAQNLRGA